MEEEVKTEVENSEVEQPQEVSPITQEDNGLIKVDLSQLSKAEAKEDRCTARATCVEHL